MRRRILATAILLSLLAVQASYAEEFEFLGYTWGSKVREDGFIPEPEKPVTLRVWTFAWAGRPDLVENWFRDFEKQHPNIKVEYSPFIATRSDERFAAAEASGTLPDLSKGYGPNSALIYRDMKAYVTRSDIADWGEENIEPWLDPQGRFPYSQFSLNSESMLWIDVDLFNEAGIEWEPYREKPWPLDRFVEDMKKLTVDLDGDGKVDRWGMGYHGSRKGLEVSQHRNLFIHLYLAYGGGYWLDREAKRVTIGREAAAKALQTWQDFIYTHRIAPEIGKDLDWDQGLWSQMKVREVASMFGGGIWFIQQIEDYNASVQENPRIGLPLNAAAVFPPCPEQPAPFACTGADGLCAKEQKDPDMERATAILWRWWGSTAQQVRILRPDIQFALAPRRSANAILAPLYADYPSYQTHMNLLFNYRGRYPWWGHPLDSQIWEQAMIPTIEAVLANEISGEEGADDIIRKAERLVKRYWRYERR